MDKNDACNLLRDTAAYRAELIQILARRILSPGTYEPAVGRALWSSRGERPKKAL